MKLHSFNPDLLRIHRYQYAIPQYGADTEGRLKAVKYLQEKHPGLLIGGNLIDGIGMADRIKQGRSLAREVGRRLNLA